MTKAKALSPSQSSSDLSAYVSTCVKHVADTCYQMLADVNPGLLTDEVYDQVVAMAEALMAGLDGQILDAESMVHIGEEMDRLDGLEPPDVQRMQVCIFQAFSETLPEDIWMAQQSDLAALLFGLAAGLYTGKSRRVARFNLTVTSQMGHDLKTPINTITGFSRIILKGIDGPVTDFQREDLVSIYEAGQRLLTMINDLYAVKKQDAERSPVYDRPFRVSELVGDILRTVQPLAAQRDHVFAVRTSGELGTLDLDVSHVRWILLCLLTHFVRATSNGVIELLVARDYTDGASVDFTLAVQMGGARPSAVGVADNSDGTTDRGSQPVVGGDGQVVFPTCQSACEALGGTMTWTDPAAGARSVTLRFPSEGRGVG
jgi:signal transduction histidine kinase